MCSVGCTISADAQLIARASMLHHDASASAFFIAASRLHTVWVLIEWVALQADLRQSSLRWSTQPAC